jgi:hypothetical protein
LIKIGCSQYFDIISRLDRPFELGNASFDKEQYRLEIYQKQVIDIYGNENAVGQKLSKSQEIPPSAMSVFSIFSRVVVVARFLFLSSIDRVKIHLLRLNCPD